MADVRGRTVYSTTRAHTAAAENARLRARAALAPGLLWSAGGGADMKSASLSRSVWIVAVMIPSVARAADVEMVGGRVGRPGSAVVGLAGVNASRTGNPDQGEVRAFGAALNLDIFVATGWSLGLGAGLSRIGSSTSPPAFDTTTTSFRIGPRVGRLIPLGSFLSLWPAVGVGYSREILSSSTPTESLTGSLDPSWLFELDVPLLLHASRYFFVAVGPTLAAAIGSGTQSLSLGSRLSFGLSFDAGG